MRFINEMGEEMKIADNVTLSELHDMGISVSLTEESDPDHQIWLDEEDDE